MDSEMKSIGFLYCRPGWRILSLPPEFLMASSKRAERLKPYFTPTMTVMTTAPIMSRLALMICTQVVPFMPPMRT